MLKTKVGVPSFGHARGSKNSATPRTQGNSQPSSFQNVCIPVPCWLFPFSNVLIISVLWRLNVHLDTVVVLRNFEDS